MKFGKNILISLSIATTLALNLSAEQKIQINESVLLKKSIFLENYSNIAFDNYLDALKDAKKLQESINKFVVKPSQANLDEAKKSWLIARESYGSTEIFRLANGPIDAEDGWVNKTYGALEGQINAWPLDENMIDYTIDADGKKNIWKYN